MSAAPAMPAAGQPPRRAARHAGRRAGPPAMPAAGQPPRRPRCRRARTWLRASRHETDACPVKPRCARRRPRDRCGAGKPRVRFLPYAGVRRAGGATRGGGNGLPCRSGHQSPASAAGIRRTMGVITVDTVFCCERRRMARAWRRSERRGRLTSVMRAAGAPGERAGGCLSCGTTARPSREDLLAATLTRTPSDLQHFSRTEFGGAVSPPDDAGRRVHSRPAGPCRVDGRDRDRLPGISARDRAPGFEWALARAGLSHDDPAVHRVARPEGEPGRLGHQARPGASAAVARGDRRRHPGR